MCGGSFQKAIDKMLRNHQDYAGGFIDNVAIFSDEWSSHLKHLKNVFKVFEDSGMTLKLKKCAFGKPKVKFVGHIVGSGEITVIKSKVDAIKLMP
jgi:hypothetical protein